MKEIRPRLENDQENIQKAYELISNLIEEHTEIESTLWVGDIYSMLVSGYLKNGFSYEDFCEELNKISEFYKSRWDDEN
jgi:hypothetical protein